MASGTPSGAPGLGGTREEWEAFDQEHYDGCFLRHPNGDPMDDPILTDAGRQYLKLTMGFGMSATHAAHHWDLGSLSLALTAGSSPDSITSEYINHGPLHAACDTIRFHYDQLDGKETFRVGKTEDDGVACVQLLLHAGASLDVLSFNGFTPLHLACNEGYVKIVRVLLSAGADASFLSPSKRVMPLHNAVTFSDAEGNCEQTVAALIAAGADIEARTGYGYGTDRRTPLARALFFGRRYDESAPPAKCLRAVPVLLRAGASIPPAALLDVPRSEWWMGSEGERSLSSTIWEYEFPGSALAHSRWAASLRLVGYGPVVCEPLPCPTRLYVERVRAAGGFERYEQAHLAKLVHLLAPKLGLPTDVLPLVIKYWAHVGFY
jgi:hypothetical protein